MKGMSCGTRVSGLVALTAVACALAPGFARADITGGAAPSVNVAPPSVPAVPAPSVPAAPAVSTPAAPAAAAPAAPAPVAAAVEKAAASAKIVGGTVTADPTTGALVIHTNMAKAKSAVSPSSGSIQVNASKVVKPANKAIQKVAAKANKVKPVHKAVQKAVQKASRVVAWTSDNPLSGCANGEFITCMVIPNAAPIDNRCYGLPPGSDSGDGTAPYSGDVVNWTQGVTVVWINTIPTTQNGMPATRMHIKTFVYGLLGAGSIDLSTYRLGHDFEDDKYVTIGLGTSVSMLTQDLLLVNEGAAPNEVYTQHIVADANGNASLFWHIVCRYGDPGDGHQGGDHDRSGDYDKYKHNHGDYHGYNDDEPSSWDQND